MGIGVLLKIDFLNPFDFSVPAAIVLGLLAASNINTIRAFMQKLVVEKDGIEIRKLLGSEKIAWSQLRNVQLLGERKSWIPKWNYWSRVHVLEYANASGKSRTVNIFPDTDNSDRMVLMLRDKLQSNSDAASGLRPATAH